LRLEGLDARLDATTRAKVDALAARFRRPRAAVLSYIMHWGLSREPAGTLDGGESEGPVRHLSLHVDADLHARVGVSVQLVLKPTISWAYKINNLAHI
jgi:hypothetical protein